MSEQYFDKQLWACYRDYGHDPVCQSALINIEKYRNELNAYHNIPKAPLTINLIEDMNAHLEARLVGLRSFQSIAYARLWMNGYILKRRLTKYKVLSSFLLKSMLSKPKRKQY